MFKVTVFLKSGCVSHVRTRRFLTRRGAKVWYSVWVAENYHRVRPEDGVPGKIRAVMYNPDGSAHLWFPWTTLKEVFI